MSDCKLKPFTKNQIFCPVCKKTMPKVPGWEKFRRNCTGEPARPGAVLQAWDLKHVEPPVPPREDNPGTELKALLASLGVKPKVNCTCNAYAAQMNDWGAGGCRARQAEIGDHLRANAGDWGWLAFAKAGVLAIANGLAAKVNWSDPFPGLVAESIRRAELALKRDPIPYTGSITRNLLMFVYPKKGPEWRRNIEQIARRMDLFNGKRVFAIATDTLTVPVTEVIEALQPFEPEVLQFQNHIGEVVAFKSLLEKVQSTDPNEITFYCHGKGVTHQGKPALPSVQRWTDAMYEVLLDGVVLAERALVSHVFAGSFRAIGRQFASMEVPFYNWHYPGTFYWFRNATLFSLPNWGGIQMQYYGTEAWPGTLVPPSRSACLLADKVPLAALYSPERWYGEYQPALDKWRERQAKRLEAVVT